MQAKTADPSEFLRTDADYLNAIDDCLKEMKAIRVDLRKLDAEFERSHASTRKKIEQTQAILRDVKKSV